jgi:very-short-patch-repair endonuclease
MKTRIARHLRRSISDVERLLWLHLRDRQIKGYRFRRQHPFRDYVLDFFCVDAKLIIELYDSEAGDAPSDAAARIAALEAAGYPVLRFANSEVSANIEGALKVIARALPEELAPRSPKQQQSEDEDELA